MRRSGETTARVQRGGERHRIAAGDIVRDASALSEGEQITVRAAVGFNLTRRLRAAF